MNNQPQVLVSNNIPPVTLTSPPTPPSPPRIKWPIIIGIFLIIIAITSAGLFLVQNLSSRKEISLPQQEVSPTSIPTAAPSTIPTIIPTQAVTISANPTFDPTTNWKTYINTKYGYSVKYPEEVDLEEGTGGEERIQETILTLLGPKYQGPGEFTDGFGITLAVINNPTQKTPMQFAQDNYRQASDVIKNKFMEGDISKCKVETVDKNSVVGARFTSCAQAPGSGVVNFSEWYTKNGNTYEIYAVLQNENYRKLFNQILSTFKLVNMSNQATPTSVINAPTSTKPVCTKDADCPSSYFCDYGISCSLPDPNGKTNCQEEGSKTCIKSCNTDTDCTNEEKCQYFSIPSGDAFFLKKGCR